ncbi:MAG: hypothetical protein F6J92_32555 [Symploca sp. SIO1A3]|nr:hypothetical protein [Symploca sp. SIO1A3]
MHTISISKHSNFIQEHLDLYKKEFPDDDPIQSVTLDDVITYGGNKVDWTNPPFVGGLEVTVLDADMISTNCAVAIGFVIFDVICLAVGGVALRGSASEQTARAIADAAEPVLSKIETSIKIIADNGSSAWKRGWEVFKILKTIYSGQCLGAVLSAFLKSLTWYKAILYGATAMATIVAALATDGTAFVAEVVILLATFGFLVSDCVKAVRACSSGERTKMANQIDIGTINTPNPRLWLDTRTIGSAKQKYIIATNSPGPYYFDINQFCSLLSIEWLLSGRGKDPYGIGNLPDAQKKQMAEILIGFESMEDQVKHAEQRLGGKEKNLNDTAAGVQGQYKVGTKIWAANYAHVTAIYLTSSTKYEIYDPDSGRTTNTYDRSDFKKYMEAFGNNVFVVKEA